MTVLSHGGSPKGGPLAWGSDRIGFQSMPVFVDDGPHTAFAIYGADVDRIILGFVFSFCALESLIESRGIIAFVVVIVTHFI